MTGDEVMYVIQSDKKKYAHVICDKGAATIQTWRVKRFGQFRAVGFTKHQLGERKLWPLPDEQHDS
jgi:hypothetical protein